MLEGVASVADVFLEDEMLCIGMPNICVGALVDMVRSRNVKRKPWVNKDVAQGCGMRAWRVMRTRATRHSEVCFKLDVRNNRLARRPEHAKHVETFNESSRNRSE